MENRIPGRYTVTAGDQPLVEVSLLGWTGMHVIPHAGAPAGWSQSGDA